MHVGKTVRLARVQHHMQRVLSSATASHRTHRMLRYSRFSWISKSAGTGAECRAMADNMLSDLKKVHAHSSVFAFMHREFIFVFFIPLPYCVFT